MNQVIQLPAARRARSRAIVLAAWGAIAVKCLLVPWAIAYWNVPVRPAVIIVPTLAMAAIVTFLWLVHTEEE